VVKIEVVRQQLRTCGENPILISSRAGGARGFDHYWGEQEDLELRPLLRT